MDIAKNNKSILLHCEKSEGPTTLFRAPWPNLKVLFSTLKGNLLFSHNSDLQGLNISQTDACSSSQHSSEPDKQ